MIPNLRHHLLNGPFDDVALEQSFQRSYRSAGLNSATIAAAFGLLVAVLVELAERIGPRVPAVDLLSRLLVPELRLLIAPLLAVSVYVGLRHRQWLLSRYVGAMALLAGLLLLTFALPLSWSEPLLLVPLRPVIGLNLLIFFVFAFLRLPGLVAVGLGIAALGGHLWAAAHWHHWDIELPTLLGYPALAATAGWLLSRTTETRERRIFLATVLAQGAEQGRVQRIDEFIHDLRGPLAALGAEMHHVVRQPVAALPADIDRRLHSMVDELAWVRDHLEDLSRWNKGDDPNAPMRLGTLPIGQLVDWMRAQFEALCRDQRVRLSIRLDPGLDDKALTTNRSGTYSVVMNLIGNAIKYRDPAKGSNAWVKVDIGAQDHFCVIRISDNGIGIAADELPRIWQAGFRSPRSMLSTDGSGLGLSIARERVERMAHHSLTARSTLAQGSQFTLRIPWARPEIAPVTQTGLGEAASTMIRSSVHEEGDDGVPSTLTATGARAPVSRVLLLASDPGTLKRASALMDPHNVFVDEASSTRALQALLREGDSTYDYMVISVTQAMNVYGMIQAVRRDHGFDVPALLMLPLWRYLKVRAQVERQIPEVRCLALGWFGDRSLRRHMKAALARSLDLQARVISRDNETTQG